MFTIIIFLIFSFCHVLFIIFIIIVIATAYAIVIKIRTLLSICCDYYRRYISCNCCLYHDVRFLFFLFFVEGIKSNCWSMDHILLYFTFFYFIFTMSLMSIFIQNEWLQDIFKTLYSSFHPLISNTPYYYNIS